MVLKSRFVLLTVVTGSLATGCTIEPITDLFLNLAIPPQAIAIPPAPEIINPGQVVFLDGAQSGVLLGGGDFLDAVESGLSFTWTILSATDRATGQPIDLGTTGAALMNANSSQATFSANTSADYLIELKVTTAGRTGMMTFIVRVI
ncbi:MAG: hypothetical protein L6Q92_00905 [Phycisphaerae bacterium]|nr:hypothetical protein [Phycisphaerae bacterium]